MEKTTHLPSGLGMGGPTRFIIHIVSCVSGTLPEEFCARRAVVDDASRRAAVIERYRQRVEWFLSLSLRDIVSSPDESDCLRMQLVEAPEARQIVAHVFGCGKPSALNSEIPVRGERSAAQNSCARRGPGAGPSPCPRLKARAIPSRPSRG